MTRYSTSTHTANTHRPNLPTRPSAQPWATAYLQPSAGAWVRPPSSSCITMHLHIAFTSSSCVITTHHIPFIHHYLHHHHHHHMTFLRQSGGPWVHRHHHPSQSIFLEPSFIIHYHHYRHHQYSVAFILHPLLLLPSSPLISSLRSSSIAITIVIINSF